MSTMIPSNSTIVMGGARLKFIPRLFKDVLLFEKQEKDNQEIP